MSSILPVTNVCWSNATRQWSPIRSPPAMRELTRCLHIVQEDAEGVHGDIVCRESYVRPRHNVLTTYMHMAAKMTNTPSIFHCSTLSFIWAALSTFEAVESLAPVLAVELVELRRFGVTAAEIDPFAAPCSSEPFKPTSATAAVAHPTVIVENANASRLTLAFCLLASRENFALGSLVFPGPCA